MTGWVGRMALGVALLLSHAAVAAPAPAAAAPAEVDVALVLAVDVSESIDAARYALQMEGIAAALESPAVQNAILSGPRQAMLITIVQWSNRPVVTLPWTLLASGRDANGIAQRVRHMKRASNGFTCMAVALRSIADKVLTQLPIPATRQVVDVSGDGQDNCNGPEPVDRVRDELVAEGVAVNGLPILEGDEEETLEAWYREHVVGGPEAFLLPAASFDDFAHAFRRKFVTEVSAVLCRGCTRDARR